MAFNALTGNVVLPGQLYAEGELSSSHYYGNGADIYNIPRFASPANNALVTNVNNDANSFVCEGNLTFDGSALTVTGEITASVGLSASFLYGDARHLINIPGAGGGAGGIFTQVSAVAAYTTSSINLGSTDTPTHRLSVRGSSFLSGGVIHKRKPITNTPYTASATDYYIGLDTSAAQIAVRLPDAASLSDGQTYIFKDEGGNAQTNNITVLASGSQTIDGQNSIVLESPYASVQVYCNGADKYYIF